MLARTSSECACGPSVAHTILDRVERIVGMRAEFDRRTTLLSRWDTLAVSLGRRVEILVQATNGEVSVTIAAPASVAAQIGARRQDLAERLERRGWHIRRVRILRLPDQGRDRP